jgi:hypothetical protein
MNNHYDGDKCWETIENMTKHLSGVEAFNVGNVLKYLYRYRKKGTPLNDLTKAKHYLERMIQDEQNRIESK